MNEFSSLDYLVISVMGPHAGESESEIFRRKIEDVKKTGKTFWLMRSHAAKPNMIQAICKEAKSNGKPVYAVFINPSSLGGAIPTSTSKSARNYSKDNKTWEALPKALSPVTGKIDKGAYALVFDELRLHNAIIDLWDYADFFNQSAPIKIIQGSSTLCAIKKTTHADFNKIKSRYRQIVATGRLCEPYGAWLR